MKQGKFYTELEPPTDKPIAISEVTIIPEYLSQLWIKFDHVTTVSEPKPQLSTLSFPNCAKAVYSVIFRYI